MIWRAVRTRLSLLLWLVPVLALTLYSFWRLLFRPATSDGWEAGFILDGWRLALGEAVWVSPSDGRSASIYGPLLPLVLGALYRVTGPEIMVGRLFNLLCALALITLLVRWLARGRPLADRALLAVCFLAIHLRTFGYWALTRPDAAQLLLAALALGASYRAVGTGRRSWAAGAAGLFLLAAAFKQWAVFLALVPPLAALWDRRRGDGRLRWGWTLLPLGAVSLAAWLTARLHPDLFRHLALPGAYAIRWGLFAEYGLGIWMGVPAFLLVAAERARRGEPEDRMGRWLVTGTAVTWVFCTLAIAKEGAAWNSYLPFYLALVALGAHWLFRLPPAPRPRWAVWAFAPLLALSFFPPRSEALLGGFVPPGQDGATAYWRFLLGPWENTREALARAVAGAAALPGKVISPEDPTLALYAKGYRGLTGVFEVDAHPVNGTYPEKLPRTLAREIASADFLLFNYRMPRNVIKPLYLRKAGFIPDPHFSVEGFIVWRRNTPRQKNNN